MRPTFPEENSYSLEDIEESSEDPSVPDVEDIDTDVILGLMRRRPKGPKVRAPVHRRVRRRHHFTTSGGQRAKRKLQMRRIRKNKSYRRREIGRTKFLSGKGGRRRSASLLEFGQRLDQVASSHPSLFDKIGSIRERLDREKRMELIKYAMISIDEQPELPRLVLSLMQQGKNLNSLAKYASQNQDLYLAEILLGLSKRP